VKNGQQICFIVYALWSVLVFAIVFAIRGIDSAGVTGILVILFLGVQFLLMSRVKTLMAGLSGRARFLLCSLLCASVVEGFHMIHEPVFGLLRITPAMSVKSMVVSYGIDLAFTLPVYLAVFSVLWFFINLYRYTLWQYFIVFGIAQALGDGGVFFFSSKPFLLLFIPYTLVNYHAMNVLPFLLVQDCIEPVKTGWRKYVMAPCAVVAVYLAGGALIKAVGSLFSLS